MSLVTSPTVGGSNGTWGATLNANMTALAGALTSQINAVINTTAVVPSASVLNQYDCTASALAPVLPAAASVTAGTTIGLKKVDSSTNVLTATCSGSDHIDSSSGSTSLPIRTQNQALWLVSDGVSVWSKVAGDLSLPALDARYAGMLTCTGVGDETAKINAWLAAATPLGIKKLVGNPTISAPLVVQSGTFFDFSLSTITLAPGSQCNMLVNAAAVAPVRSVTDAAVTVGRTDSVGTTNSSATVTDTSIVSGDFGRPVSGAGIPAGSYVGTVTAGTGFLLSSTSGSQTNVTATATATVSAALGSVLTSATAAFTSTDVGRTVSVAGAYLTGPFAPTTGPLIANITAVPSATTAVLSVAAQVTVAGAAMSIYNRDKNIRIVGGTLDRVANGWNNASIPSNPLLTSTRFRHMDSFKIRDLTLTSEGTHTAGLGFHLSLGDIFDFDIDNITISCPTNVQNSDGINIQGPAARGSINRVYGVNGDDFVALLAMNPDLNLRDTVGDITDIDVSKLLPAGNTGSAFKICTGGGTTARSITCRGIHGSTASMPGTAAVWIGDYITGQPSTLIDGILIDNVDVLTSSTCGLAIIQPFNSATGQITLSNFVWRNPSPTSGMAVISVAAGSVLGALNIDGLAMEALGNGVIANGTLTCLRAKNIRAINPAVTYNSIISLSGTSTTNVLIIEDIITRLPSGTTNAVVSLTGSLAKMIVNDLDMATGGNFLYTQSTASALIAIFNNVNFNGAQQFASIQSQVDFILSNFTVTTVTGGNMIGLIAGGSQASIRGKGIIGTPTWFYRSASQTVQVVNPDIRLDVSILAKNNGDTAYNTNASVAPFATGVAVCDGTTWRLASSGATKTGTATLVAGTIAVADTAVTANSVIRLSSKTAGGTPGATFIASRTAGTGFTITSTSATDTSVIQYDIVTY